MKAIEVAHEDDDDDGDIVLTTYLIDGSMVEIWFLFLGVSVANSKRSRGV